jgi:hypothetical protein
MKDRSVPILVDIVAFGDNKIDIDKLLERIRSLSYQDYMKLGIVLELTSENIADIVVLTENRGNPVYGKDDEKVKDVE